MAEVQFGNPAGAAPAPVIEVKSEVVSTPTPVPGVAVESVNTHAAAPAAAPSQAVATRPSHSLSNRGGFVLGDVIPDFSEIVNLVHGIGKLKESFPVGAIVFNQSTVLFTPPLLRKNEQLGVDEVVSPALPPVNITVLGFRPTRFVEKVDGGGRGIICNTEDQVRSCGGTLDYKEWELKKASGAKLFQPLAEALVAIRRPAHCADDDSVFVYPVDGHKYALGLWGMKGSAYTAAAKTVFFTHRKMGCLMKGYPTKNYNFTTKLKPLGPKKNPTWVPVCIPAENSTPEFIAFVSEVLGGSVAPQQGAPDQADE
jgi:hypothetical protein